MNLLPDMVQLVKKAAVEAVEASKPVQFIFGQVISAYPLKIRVDQKSIYTEKMLVLTRNVTEHEIDISISAQEGSHSIKGQKRIKVHNGLVASDWVVMARIQKGKRYVVLDRVKPNPALKGEWL